MPGTASSRKPIGVPQAAQKSRSSQRPDSSQGPSATPIERQASALRHRGDRVQILAGLGRCTRQRERVHHAGHAATLFRLGGRCRHDVVGQQHGAAADVVELDQVAGHVEVHDIATVVAVKPQNAGAALGGTKLPIRPLHRLRHS